MAVGIYALISEERLKSVLETLYTFLEIPVQLIDEKGQILQTFGEPYHYCSLLKEKLFQKNECFEIHRKAGEYAMRLGETYIFTCHADLNHVAFPLIHQGELLGSIIAGPFLINPPDNTLIIGLVDRYQISSVLALELYDHLSDLMVFTPARVNAMKKLMDHMLSPLLPAERVLLLKEKDKMYQQARVNETIQIYKEQQTNSNIQLYYEKETELLTKVRTHNLSEAKNLLNELIAYIIFSEGRKLESIKRHAIELSAVISRAAIESGALMGSIFDISKQFFDLVCREKNLDNLFHHMQEMLESYMNTMVSDKNCNNQYIRQALLYMAKHYAENLTLSSVAATVGLSSNHFSALLQKHVGISFREYLNHIRIEESKRLLLYSDYSLTDIAVAVGFTDQSYYCMVFKKMVGLPPGQYRNQ